MKTIVIIPAYEPEEKLIPLTQQLIAKNLEVVVVDDGSGENYLPIFNQLTGATVLTHPENKGKGEALKTAYQYIKETYADKEVAIVTADSDGQHSPEDIVRIANAAARSAQKKDLFAGFWFYGAMAAWFLILTTFSIAILWWLRRRYSAGYQIEGT